MKVQKLTHCLLLLAWIFALLAPNLPASAQTAAKGPVYVVQPGDTLNSIAYRFNVNVNDLIAANGITDANMLQVGMELVIPGLQGVTGKLITVTVPLGETLGSLSQKYAIPAEMLVKLNKLTSPAEVYAGASLILTQPDENAPARAAQVLDSGQSLLERAVLSGQNPWALFYENNLTSAWTVPAGTALYAPAAKDAAPSGPLPAVDSLVVENLPLVQGRTVVVRVTANRPVKLSGTLINRALNFFADPARPNQYVALQGIYALAKTGLAPFSLTVTPENGQPQQFEQMVLVQAGGYVEDPPLFVDPETIDPATTKPEDDQVKQLTTPATEPRQWDGLFRVPVDEPVCIKSWYGNRRSYNGSEYNYFHTGVDYGVCANLNIYAPAAGTVVFAGPMTVRGNATIIDHGWGIYTGIYHQAEIQVKVGDKVTAGQLIGQIGKTGRVTGPHLHWDLFVNGVQVQPLDWLEKVYP